LPNRTESAPPDTIIVTSAAHTYRVVIGQGLASQSPAILRDAGLAGTVAVVSSPPIWRAQGRRLARLARPHGPLLMPDGERAKTLRSIEGLYKGFGARRLDRGSTIVAFGGGVVGDTAGFAAATYLRGLRLVQIPTTLLSQVDSAIGGKTGINLPFGKNLAGAFHPPSLVIIDPTLLRSLPPREYRAGLYEVIKYGVIQSAGLFSKVASTVPALVRLRLDVLTPVIAECCRIKARVVEEDEHEAGPRRVLNFGHTIGHALEAVTRYRRFLHGEAVGYGMLAAARLSVMRGVMPAADEGRLAAVMSALGRLPRVSDLRATAIVDAAAHDKKIIDGRLHFVLSAGIGRTRIVNDVTRAELIEAARAIGCRA
jgi:3-dehydroquinate synthase